MRKLIFITRVPYMKWEHHRFGAEYMMERGHSVEIWAPFETYSSKYEEDGRLYQGENLFVLKEGEFEKRVAENTEAIYIFIVLLYPWMNCVMENNCRYVLQFNLVCSPALDNVTHSFSKEKKKKLLINKIQRSLKRGIIENVRMIKKKSSQISDYQNSLAECARLIEQCPPYAVYSATRFGIEGRLKESPEFIRPVIKEKAVYLHSTDYDRYIEANRGDMIIKEKHILFCDSGLTASFLPGNFTAEPRKAVAHKMEYYQQLEVLFHILEDYYHLPVVISGHPRCYYTEDDFCGRSIITNRTCELSRDAAVVIFNFSTSVSFPILYNKPMLIAYNNAFIEDYYNSFDNRFDNTFQSMKTLAEKLKINMLDLGDKEAMREPWKLCTPPEPVARASYIANYIIDSQYTEKTTAEYMEADILKL